VDEQKKQKVLLGVLGVLVLGAGTYYFVFSGSSTKSDATSDEVVARRQRDPAERRTSGEGERRERPKEERVRAEEETAERRVREESDEEESARRKRRTEQGEVKKKEMKPAA
jgi:flagellar basal body-associated protein FliL